MDDLGQNGQVVGGSDGIADNLERVLIFLIVHSHCTYGGSAEGVKMRTFVASPSRDFSFLKDSEDTKGLHSDISQFDVGGVWPNRDF